MSDVAQHPIVDPFACWSRHQDEASIEALSQMHQFRDTLDNIVEATQRLEDQEFHARFQAAITQVLSEQKNVLKNVPKSNSERNKGLRRFLRRMVAAQGVPASHFGLSLLPEVPKTNMEGNRR